MNKKKIVIIILAILAILALLISMLVSIRNKRKMIYIKNAEKGSMEIDIGNIETEDLSKEPYYLDKKKLFDFANYQSAFELSSEDMDDISQSMKDYKVAEIPITLTNNYNGTIEVVTSGTNGSLQAGLWYDRTSMVEVTSFTLIKGETTDRKRKDGTEYKMHLRFIYDSKRIRKEDVEKTLKEGKIEITYSIEKTDKNRNITIDTKTAKFAF